jgi:hypothetical protein
VIATARRDERRIGVPVGFIWGREGEREIDPDRRAFGSSIALERTTGSVPNEGRWTSVSRDPSAATAIDAEDRQLEIVNLPKHHLGATEPGIRGSTSSAKIS